MSAEPSSGMVRYVSAYHLNLFESDDGIREGVELQLSSCTNSECSCTVLFVRARAFDQQGDENPVLREPSFDLTYDVATNVLGGFEPPRTAAEAGFQSALRSALRRKAMKKLLRREFDESRARLEPVADPSYDFAAHQDGTLAAYLVVYPSAGYVTITHEGSKYALDDQWCVRPDCPCEDGVIDLLPLPDETGHELAVRSIGAFRYPSGKPVAGRPPVDAMLVADMLGGRAREWLATRRTRLRAEAARRWPARRAGAASPATPHSILARREDVGPAQEKVGRNERCPCGSGKKFKQCCLRAEP
jgi:SEC-C motif